MTTYRTLMALVVLLASPAFAQSQRRNNLTAKDTLRWMQTSLESGSGDYWVGHEMRSLRLEDFAGCKVHFSASFHQQPFANGEPAPDKKPTTIDYFFELGDIDPANITFSKGPDSRTDVPSFITIRTRNDEKKITSGYSWESKVGAQPDYTFVIFTVEAFGSDNDYVVRFAAAFKHAVEACGGKPSSFADSDTRNERAHTAPGGGAVQSAPHRKDIATIAKEANGAVVSIVMSDKEGHPISQGSGFLMSKDGWVVTNYHVIKSGTSAVVKLPDGAFFPVDGIVASDKGRDVAIIKAHGNDFRTLTFGDSARLQVGEEVVAIGNPLSLESTVSNGIVSAIRTVEEEGGKFLQITAPISHGSSGGPLLNMAGEVVGITSAVIMGGENLNFAIPIDDVKPMIGRSVSKVRSGAGVGSALPDEAEPGSTEPATGPSTQSVQNEPSLEETMTWMKNVINNGDIANQSFTISYGVSAGYHSFRTKMDYSKCVVSVNETMTSTGPLSPPMDTTATYNLKDIDPSSIRNTEGAQLELKTTNNAKTILFEGTKPFSFSSFSSKSRFQIKESDDRDRFSKALVHAILLCGGKPSAF